MTIRYGLRLLLLVPAFVHASHTDLVPEIATGYEQKEAVTASQFMVTTAHPLATQAGYDVLNNGGNAIDAMVAVQTVLGLVEPQSSGLGGGAFLLYYDAKQQTLRAFNGRETAPAAITSAHFLDETGKPYPHLTAVNGGHSVATPSVVKLMAQTHQRYGKTPWVTLFKPAATLAREGFEVSNRLERLITWAQPELLANPQTRALFFDRDGQPLKAGMILKNPAYADTVERLAREGEALFYRGDIARTMVDAVQNSKPNQGLLTMNDLANYQITESAAVCSEFREYELCGMPPPSSGGYTIGQIFLILEAANIDQYIPESAQAWHIVADATRLAFADRNRYLADPAFVSIPHGLLDSDYLQTRAKTLTPGTALKSVEAGSPPNNPLLTTADNQSPEFPSTSHFSIVDKEGNVVSMTSSIEYGFGSKVFVHGFLLNNQLTDFSFVPEQNGQPVANRIEPNKRPLSSMSPTIVFKNDKPYLVIGSPGGSRIIGYVANTLVRHLVWDKPMQEAINEPHLQNRSGVFELEEDTWAEDYEQRLQRIGYKTLVMEMNSGIHSIVIEDELLTGHADPRRDGVAMGR